MKDYLVFRLRGVFASWGKEVMGTPIRLSQDHPSKSAIMGLIAAALGVTRNDEELQRALCNDYDMAVFVEIRGSQLNDYHTVSKYGTEDDETSNLTSRYYYVDVLYTIIIYLNNDKACYSLEYIKNKLIEPELSLYLGRKACPLTLPPEPQIITCNSIMDIFENVTFKSDSIINKPNNKQLINIYWEGTDNKLIPQFSDTRRDKILSRRRWQFTNRNEHSAILTREVDNNVHQ